MAQRASELSRRIESFKDDVIAFVEDLSGPEWGKKCEWEEWSVGVTACHLGAGHFAIASLLEMIVKGEALPQLTADQITTMSKEKARGFSDSTPAAAVALLRKNGTELAAYVAGLTDADLDRKGSMPAFGGELTAGKAIDAIIFQSGGQHFASMKTAVGR